MELGSRFGAAILWTLAGCDAPEQRELAGSAGRGAAAGQWVELPGCVKEISAADDVMALGCDRTPHGYPVLLWQGAWATQPGLATQIATHLGGAFVANAHGSVFSFEDGAYQQLTGTSGHVASSPAGELWGLGVVPGSASGPVRRLHGAAWEDQGISATRVSVGRDGTPWIADEHGAIFRRVEGTWESVEGCARDVAAVSRTRAWAIGCAPAGPGGYQIWEYDNGWIPRTGAGVEISADHAGEAFVVNATDQAFRLDTNRPYRLRIATFNAGNNYLIEHEERVAEYFIEKKLDVLALQEVPYTYMINDIEDELIRRGLRDVDIEYAGGAKGGKAIISRLELDDGELLFHEPTQMYAQTVLAEVAPGVSVRVTNIHPGPPQSLNSSYHADTQQQLDGYTEARQVLVGDFNLRGCTEDNWADAWAGACDKWAGYLERYDRVCMPNVDVSCRDTVQAEVVDAIDHILTHRGGSSFAVREAYSDHAEDWSDHFPVVAELAFD